VQWDEDSEPRPTPVQQLAEKLAMTKLKTSQIRNLENLAYSTDKISDITDLLKKLIGRDTHSQRWAQNNLGQEVVKALEGLRAQATQIEKNLPGDLKDMNDTDLVRRIHLALCREYARHLAAHFFYLRRDKEESDD
jgi:hypothetical protein